MKIIYVHHAERDISNRYENMPSYEKQSDGITSVGRREAEDIADRLKNNNWKIRAIVTSPYKRCMETAKILNKCLDVKIIEDSRFNEVQEPWDVALTRIQDGIKNIINRYDNDDIIICVTSGVNITAFMCLELDKKADKNTPYVQALTMSPIVFNYNKENFK